MHSFLSLSNIPYQQYFKIIIFFFYQAPSPQNLKATSLLRCTRWTKRQPEKALAPNRELRCGLGSICSHSPAQIALMTGSPHLVFWGMCILEVGRYTECCSNSRGHGPASLSASLPGTCLKSLCLCTNNLITVTRFFFLHTSFNSKKTPSYSFCSARMNHFKG